MAHPDDPEGKGWHESIPDFDCWPMGPAAERKRAEDQEYADAHGLTRSEVRHPSNAAPEATALHNGSYADVGLEREREREWQWMSKDERKAAIFAKMRSSDPELSEEEFEELYARSVGICHAVKLDYVAEALRWFARRHPDTGRWHPAFRSESEVPDYLTPDEQRRAITEAITEHEGDEEALAQLRAALAELDAEEATTEGQPVTVEDALAAALTDDQLAAHTDAALTGEVTDGTE